MYIDDIKLFYQKQNLMETLIQAGRIYRQDVDVIWYKNATYP